MISTSANASTSAGVAIVNYSTGQVVTGSEASTTSAIPTLVSASFAGDAANFTDLQEMEVRIRNSGAGTDAWIYKSGLWISLTNLSHAEVYYRYARTEWSENPNGNNIYDFGVTLLDTALYSLTISVFHDVTGFITQATTPCTVEMIDVGATDTGVGETGNVGTAVANSALSFSSTAKSRQRSAGLSITSGHRFVSNARRNAGPGACLLLQPRIVVGF